MLCVLLRCDIFGASYRWHWLVGAPGAMLACWGSVALPGLLGQGPVRVGGWVVVVTPGEREAGLLGLSAAEAPLED